MRGKSHYCLGQYLVRRYMPNISPIHARAFLVGCVQPDKNPATYLKGSLCCQWLRGHNYLNAKRFMHRIARRLERKTKWRIYDYYTLGKLIHYTADSFTLAHNAAFPTDLDAHRNYESILQNHFLAYLDREPTIVHPPKNTVTDAITHYRRQYERASSGIFTDAAFTLHACSCVVATVRANQTP